MFNVRKLGYDGWFYIWCLLQPSYFIFIEKIKSLHNNCYVIIVVIPWKNLIVFLMDDDHVIERVPYTEMKQIKFYSINLPINKATA